jgi:hypothetical protein
MDDDSDSQNYRPPPPPHYRNYDDFRDLDEDEVLHKLI